MTASESDKQSQNSAENKPKQQARAGNQGRKRRSRRKKKKSRAKQAQRARVPSEIDPIVAAFVACGRCSFFLSGYRAQRGADAFVEDVRQIEDKWITLAWHDGMASLIKKSYGVEMEDGLFHLEHCCKECHRAIIYDVSAENSDAAPIVQAQLKPG